MYSFFCFRKEEEAWKKKDKELTAKQAELSDKERQWKEKEDALCRRLKELGDRLRLREEETGSLRREASSAKEGLDKAKLEADCELTFQTPYSTGICFNKDMYFYV